MDPADPIESSRRRTGHRWLDMIVASSAILIAVVSLVVALRQSQIMERQLAASVWPYLQYGTSNQADDGKQIIGFVVENAGVGPARVHSMALQYEGKPIRNSHELVDACCKDLLESSGKPNFWTSTVHDQVLTPNRSISFLLLTDTPGNAPYWKKLNTVRHQVQIKLCYCSVLDQCWMLDSSTTEPKPTAACPAPQPDDFQD